MLFQILIYKYSEGRKNEKSNNIIFCGGNDVLGRVHRRRDLVKW